MIALIEAVQGKLFSRKNILQNVCAGIVVGIISIPLSMAFAIASNVTPEIGLHTAMIAAFCVSMFGGSRVQISGPTGAFAGMLISISSQFGFDGLQLATIMAGCMLIIMGTAKVGKMIKFIPEQVIIGFTAGLAINIFIGQIPHFFGLACGKLSVNFSEKLSQITHAFPSINFQTTAVACASLLVLVYGKKTPLRIIPGPMLALIFGLAIQHIFRCDSVATIGSAFGGMPNSLPVLRLPSNISFQRVISLVSPAFAIAMLGAIESLLSAVIADKITGNKHSSNQELIGQGIANIACPLLGGIASTGSIARTASSIRAGGNSPLAGMVSSATLMIVICFCAPLAADIPLATLAAIVFMVAYNMSSVKTLASIVAYAPRLDAITLMVTLFLTVTCGIVFATNVGVVLASLILVYRMSTSADVSPELCDPHVPALPREIAIYKISGPLFFGMIDKFEEIMNSVNGDVKVLILRMQKVLFIDTSGLQILRVMIGKFASSGRRVILAESAESVMQRLHRSHVFDSTDNENYDRSLDEAIRIAKKFHGNMIAK